MTKTIADKIWVNIQIHLAIKRLLGGGRFTERELDQFIHRSLRRRRLGRHRFRHIKRILLEKLNATLKPIAP